MSTASAKSNPEITPVKLIAVSEKGGVKVIDGLSSADINALFSLAAVEFSDPTMQEKGRKVLSKICIEIADTMITKADIEAYRRNIS